MSADNFFQETGGNRVTVDYVVWDTDTVSIGGRMIKRKKKDVYQ